ncbi:SLOG cluster 4 domain-containing protein [Nocardia higoensis]|uniref:SLOG cluster 4 domain-containing protein n=1 Tax=Nocardia higoensis TaxID=228599 RepID=UPI000A0248F0|nr:LOG family protein [Nocardia higoensis]
MTRRTDVRPLQVAVCGPRHCTSEDAHRAKEIGRLLAEAGVTVICGGGMGVMAAVAEGAASAGGTVIGIRPDTDRAAVCPGLTAVLFTNMGEARNSIIIESADVVIVVGGSWGTLSELALANRRGNVPVISIGGWRILDNEGREVSDSLHVKSPEEAVSTALTAANDAAR